MADAGIYTPCRWCGGTGQDPGGRWENGEWYPETVRVGMKCRTCEGAGQVAAGAPNPDGPGKERLMAYARATAPVKAEHQPVLQVEWERVCTKGDRELIELLRVAYERRTRPQRKAWRGLLRRALRRGLVTVAAP